MLEMLMKGRRLPVTVLDARFDNIAAPTVYDYQSNKPKTFTPSAAGVTQQSNTLITGPGTLFVPAEQRLTIAPGSDFSELGLNFQISFKFRIASSVSGYMFVFHLFNTSTSDAIEFRFGSQQYFGDRFQLATSQKDAGTPVWNTSLTKAAALNKTIKVDLIVKKGKGQIYLNDVLQNLARWTGTTYTADPIPFTGMRAFDRCEIGHPLGYGTATGTALYFDDLVIKNNI